MAPLTTSSLGYPPQTLDDPLLKELLSKLKSFPLAPPTIEDQDDDDDVLTEDPTVPSSQQVDDLVLTLESYQPWPFEEQVDLQEWIHPLNVIDAALSYLTRKYPALFLVPRVQRKKKRVTSSSSSSSSLSRPAESLEEVESVPDAVVKKISILVRFLASLLRNCCNKVWFNSVEDLVDLLGAADDTLAKDALEALCSLSMPPSLHKQQAPEVSQHTTGLHNKGASHGRLLALARGWGTRGSGLGLFTCVTADDSELGQGSIPAEAGELNFDFFAAATVNKPRPVDETVEDGGESAAVTYNLDEDARLVRIHLPGKEFIVQSDSTKTSTTATTSPDDTSEPMEDEQIEASKQKRRRVGSVEQKTKLRINKSTAELFFQCIEQAGGKSIIPDERLFPLLADIRLAKAFHSHSSRVDAVERRLLALVTILHCHPSQEIMSGYFHAQPELCVELADLLRPTVSTASVSSASAQPAFGRDDVDDDLRVIASLSDSPGGVPYKVRTLALEALTALIGRREGTTGSLTGAARHSSVMNEIGVGKGQYLGLLPTLIRYSLASLGTFLLPKEKRESRDTEYLDISMDGGDEAMAMDIGLAFVEASRPPLEPRFVRLERALEFVDSVLTLTSAVVSAPSGTSALTECGLIPALLSTVAADPRALLEGSDDTITSSLSERELKRVRALLRFISAQAVQIIEGAIVTHNNALTAFHDLQGVNVLTNGLWRGIQEVRSDSGLVGDATDKMDVKEPAQGTSDDRKLCFSQRVLLFSLVNCLTVVFHQESTSSASSTITASGGAQLRKPELVGVLIEIMEHVECYGGVLAALTSSLLSDIMNSDPHVVQHVHTSGLAASFMKMLLNSHKYSVGEREYQAPLVPPVPELIMAIPNVLSALALTEDGAKAVRDVDPFPSLISIFCQPKYAMPRSRCLLNELPAIVGTGLDEIMRHVPTVKPMVMSAIVNALNSVADSATELLQVEDRRGEAIRKFDAPASDEENTRTCIVQYALSFGQMLEQILHNEDHCTPFVVAGGLRALLRLLPCMMPTGYQFLSHASCLSCPSVSTLTHSTTEDSLTAAFKCIALHYESHKLMKEIVDSLLEELTFLEQSENAVREALSVEARSDPLDATDLLSGLPRSPLYDIPVDDFSAKAKLLATFFRHVVITHWLTSLLACVIKAASQRSQESGNGWGPVEREWKQMLSTPDFEQLVDRLSSFHRSAIFEVCRVRTEKPENDDSASLADINVSLRYRLRIVCPEGAVVRDGIEIDSCATVGSMEMGEIVEAFDRCINSSGVLRYRTRRGWISELTRGHGREPIAEVIRVWQPDSTDLPVPVEKEVNKKRIEFAVPDLRTVGAHILARAQNSYMEVFSALSRVLVHGVRGLQVRSFSLEKGTIGAHVRSLVKMIARNMRQGFNNAEISDMVSVVFESETSEQRDPPPTNTINEAGAAMYLGCMLSHLHSCLFEEKRERKTINVALLLHLVGEDSFFWNGSGTGTSIDTDRENRFGFVSAARYIFRHSLTDFANRASLPRVVPSNGESMKPSQRVARSVAASLPPAVGLLRRLVSGQLITASPATAVLARLKKTELIGLFDGGHGMERSLEPAFGKDLLFQPDKFVLSMLCILSDTALCMWKDPRFIHAPPFVVHPLSTLAGEVMIALEDSSKEGASKTERGLRVGGQWDLFSRSARRNSLSGRGDEEEDFEPSDDAISQLMEMGFSHDRALDALESTQSNRVEVAMEYALSRPPPSPASIERRRVAREERRRRREGNQAGANVEVQPGNPGADSAQVTIESSSDPQNPEQNENAMDVEPLSAANPKPDDKVEGLNDKAKSCLDSWIEVAPIVCTDMLAGTSSTSPTDSTTMVDSSSRADPGQGEGDGEVEALTVVLCSFLLEMCQRHPSERAKTFSGVIHRLKAQLSDLSAGDYQVIEGKESAFAALCHATVLFTRALPNLRTSVLQECLVCRIVSCVEGFVSTIPEPPTNDVTICWPVWLAPSLLLLDIMAQPIVAFSHRDDKTVKTTDGEMDSGGSAQSEMDSGGSAQINELHQVQDEHKAQASSLAEIAQKIFSSIGFSKGAVVVASESKVVGEVEDVSEQSSEVAAVSGKDKDTTDSVASTDQQGNGNPFSSIPSYFPLLPFESASCCAKACLNILGARNMDLVTGKPSSPPPGIVQATLLLLMRLIRSPLLATRCLRMGAAEAVLSLQKESRFTGCSGLATLILRRLLEDEPTLQTSMEAEIRGTVTKLLGKQTKGASENGSQSVSRTSFMEAITPLLCRDPVAFLRACAVSVTVISEKGESAATSEDHPETRITLLSPEQRSRNLQVLSDLFQSQKPAEAATQSVTKLPTTKRGGHSSRHKRNANVVSNKNKSPQRYPIPKRKPRKERGDEGFEARKADTTYPCPSNHVISLLINQVAFHHAFESTTFSAVEGNKVTGDSANVDDGGFLWISEILQILADLVLAVPACAVSIQKYRPPKGKDRPERTNHFSQLRHALSGSPSPPKTFMNFLLHCLLPQDRWKLKNDKDIWETENSTDGSDSENVKMRRKNAYKSTSIAQASARILVALAARPGEGRKRLVVDLAFALSGGLIGNSSANAPKRKLSGADCELQALQAWGEVCMALVSPRSTNFSNDGNIAPSIDTARVMLESGMVHALLVAIHHVKPHHPMAATTCGALLLPLEVLTRTSVSDGVRGLVEKGSSTKPSPGSASHAADTPSSRSPTGIDAAFGTSDIQQHDVANDDDRNDPGMEFGVDDDESDMEEVADEDGDVEMEEENEDDSNEDGESSSDESDESSEEDEDDDDEEVSEDDGEEGEEESHLDESDEASDHEEDDNVNPELNFEMGIGADEEDDPEEGGYVDTSEQDLDEEWTRIESSGFGGMLLGGVRRNNLTSGSGNLNRSRAIVDAAQAMLGTLLGGGEFNGDALAELEGTLGIRIGSAEGRSIANMGVGVALGGNWMQERRTGGSAQLSRTAHEDVMGTLPHVQQRNPPDASFSSIAGRWSEVSPMEYVYGGPSLTSGSRNFDLVSPIQIPDHDPYPSLTQGDWQLFPGGPVAATRPRTHQALHPLLCGVDLPPMNSLVSDLLPHGVRASRRGQVSTRRPGEWTNATFPGSGFLVSTSNGNIIRLNRSHTGAPISPSNRAATGPVGWTDDGLPLDATVEEFTAEFDRALREATSIAADASNQGAATDSNPGTVGVGSSTTATGLVASEEADGAAPMDQEGTNSNQIPAEVLAGERGLSNGDGNAIDGDEGVASSLATGLRLSPDSDTSFHTDHMPTTSRNSTADDAVESPPSVSQLNLDDNLNNNVQENARTPDGRGSSTGNGDDNFEGVQENESLGISQTSDMLIQESEDNTLGLACPPGMDPGVFSSLPLEMQQEIADQQRIASELAAQLDAGSSLDPEALAALPAEMRREVIEQEQQERRLREQAPADPAHAEEMDNASFVASLSPELREEILMTADDAFLNSLPPNIIAEAQVLRERAATAAHMRLHEDSIGLTAPLRNGNQRNAGTGENAGTQAAVVRGDGDTDGVSSRRKQRTGKIRVEVDRPYVVYLPPTSVIPLSPPVAKSDLKVLLRMMYILAPVRPQRLLQKVFQNLSTNKSLRIVLSSVFVKLLHDDVQGTLSAIDAWDENINESQEWRILIDEMFSECLKDFPPPFLLGAAPDMLETESMNSNMTVARRKMNSSTAASIAANLPTSSRGSSQEQLLPPVVANRIVDTLTYLCKTSPKFCLHMLVGEGAEHAQTIAPGNSPSCFEELLFLLEKPHFSKSSANLEQLLSLLEAAVSPLSYISRDSDDDHEISQREVDSAAATGKEWLEVPRIVVSQQRLQLLCSILRMETCRDTAFSKVNAIVRRLCRIEANRGYILAELAIVTHALGEDAVRDLRALKIRMQAAVARNREQPQNSDTTSSLNSNALLLGGSASASVALSTSTSEVKLLRVLQTLQSLCGETSDENGNKKSDGNVVVSEELVHLLRDMDLENLWNELNECLKIVQILEGVSSQDDSNENKRDETPEEDASAENGGTGNGKKLQNSIASLLTRFLPSIEAFFVVNASVMRDGLAEKKEGDEDLMITEESEAISTIQSNSFERGGDLGSSCDGRSLEDLVGGTRLADFASNHKVLLNALIRNNPGLIDKGLRAMVQVSRCRAFLDFDVKRQWFKTQVRRLRQHASRRHGSLRLHIRRDHVFEDAYHQLRLRNADEMRGRLHITFRNEEGVDAGGLSREFFGILAKEIFNPNYALFTSTEDGCTFQPNPNSSINPDHLSYFRFVGRIVGKAVSDGFLLDAHFTRSLYKHMLGLKVMLSLLCLTSSEN